MAGLPGQGSLAPQRWVDLRRDLDELLTYDPGHLSLYSLTVEPGTDLAGLVAGRAVAPVADETSDQQWLRARQVLLDRGFEWYEISNFARPGRRSIHNQAYWRLDPWAGLGPGAEGTLPARAPDGALRPLRTRNPKLFPWLSGARDQEFLTAADFALEHYLCGWRTSDGLVPGRWESVFSGRPAPAPLSLAPEARLVLDRHLQALQLPSDLVFGPSWPSVDPD